MPSGLAEDFRGLVGQQREQSPTLPVVYISTRSPSLKTVWERPSLEVMSRLNSVEGLFDPSNSSISSSPPIANFGVPSALRDRVSIISSLSSRWSGRYFLVPSLLPAIAIGFIIRV